jgi:hypothetical protein
MGTDKGRVQRLICKGPLWGSTPPVSTDYILESFDSVNSGRLLFSRPEYSVFLKRDAPGM